MSSRLLPGGKRTLVVSFIPSVERDGKTLVFDEPVVIHCYTTPRDASSQAKLEKLAAFCRRMGREAKQGEVGLVIADQYYAIRDYKEASR